MAWNIKPTAAWARTWRCPGVSWPKAKERAIICSTSSYTALNRSGSTRRRQVGDTAGRSLPPLSSQQPRPGGPVRSPDRLLAHRQVVLEHLEEAAIWAAAQSPVAPSPCSTMRSSARLAPSRPVRGPRSGQPKAASSAWNAGPMKLPRPACQPGGQSPFRWNGTSGPAWRSPGPAARPPPAASAAAATRQVRSPPHPRAHPFRPLQVHEVLQRRLAEREQAKAAPPGG